MQLPTLQRRELKSDETLFLDCPEIFSHFHYVENSRVDMSDLELNAHSESTRGAGAPRDAFPRWSVGTISAENKLSA